MGNCCCGNNTQRRYEKQHIKPLIKIQSAARAFLAKKRLKETRDQKIKTLFGGIILNIIFILYSE